MLVIFLNNRRPTHQSWALNSASIFSEIKEIAFAKKESCLAIHPQCPSVPLLRDVTGLPIYVGILLLSTSHGLQPRVHTDVMAFTFRGKE